MSAPDQPACEAPAKGDEHGPARRAKGRKRSPETRAKIAAANKGRKRSPETRAKLSANAKAQWADPETRAKLSAGLADPETRAKIAAANKGRKRSPETRAKLSANAKARLADPEARAKMAAMAKARWARASTPKWVPADLIDDFNLYGEHVADARAEPFAPLEESRPVSLVDREHDQCCWPLGDFRSKTLLYCGAARSGDAPYCDVHLLLRRAKSYENA